MSRLANLAAMAGLTLALAPTTGARAAVVSATYNQTLGSTPIALSFNGVGSVLFTTIATGFGPGAWVATMGTGQVTTIGGTVTDFFAGASIDQTGELYGFGGVSTPQMIPFSATDDFIGLSLKLSDGVHFGYAEVNGPSLVGVGFETSANTSIATGATGASSAGLLLATGAGTDSGGNTPTATPEPASIALLATGLAVLSLRRRWNRATAVQTS